MKKLSLPNYIKRSGATFETTEKFIESSVVVDTTSKEIKKAGVPLIKIDDNIYATSDDELHCFVIGESGCGKTRRVILPSVRIMAKTGQSMVLSDPKGELYKTTAGILKTYGYNVRIINFRNPNKGNRWNPLGIIEKHYKSGNRELKDKAIMELGDLVSVLSDGREGHDPFWITSAASVFKGVALIILEYGECGDLTFENIALLAREIARELTSDANYYQSTFYKFYDSLLTGSAIQNNLSVMISSTEGTRNNIMATFESMISLYISQELLMDMFSESEIDIDELGKRPTALFIVLPDDSEALYPIATVLVQQVYSALVNLADEQQDGKLPNMVSFVLDEFANFAKMPSIESMLTAARSRRIRFILVCQSMDQLTSKYGDSGREILLANCRIWVYMSCRNLPFLRTLEELIGFYISPYTNERLPLIDISELQHFQMGEVLILNNRCKPITGYLDDYGMYEFGDGDIGTVKMPDENPAVDRIKVNAENILRSATRANEPIRIQKKKEKEAERQGLRASILSKIAEKKDNYIDVDEEDNQKDKTVFELFLEDKYYEAAQKCVDDYDGGIELQNNLAFLIRYAKLDKRKIQSDFELDIPSLLERGINEKEGVSIVNMAMYEIGRTHYRVAVDFLTSLEKQNWISVLEFWRDVLWNKRNDTEGALITYIASLRGVSSVSAIELEKIRKAINAEYLEFLSSEEFKLMIEENKQGMDTEEEYMTLLVKSTEGKSESKKSVEKKESNTETDKLKAMLQKKIKEQLDENKES